MRHPKGISFTVTAFALWSASIGEGAPLQTADDSDFSVRTWQVEDGLPSNSIRAIAQTTDGYIWLGTYDGLVRFDGVRFVLFNTDNAPELESHRVWALAADKAGALWIGTEGAGVKRLLAGKFQSFTPQQGLTNDFVTTLYADGEGGVWAGGPNGVDRIHDNTITHFPLVGGQNVFLIGGTRSGRVWAHVDHAFQIFRNGKFELWKPAPIAETARRWMATILEDSRGRFWAGLDGGDTFRWRTNEMTVLKWGKDMPDRNWELAAEDAGGNIWFGFIGRGVGRFNGSELKFLGVESGLSSVVLTALFVDREDNVWITTENGGLNRIERRFVSNITQRHGLGRFAVKAIYPDGEDGLWVANDCEGLFRFRHGAFDSGSSGVGCLWSLLRTRSGEVWTGTYESRVAVRRTALEMRPELIFRTNGPVRALLEDPTGTIWIASNRAILRFHHGQLTSFTAGSELSGSRFSAFAEDRDGAIWAGSMGGGLHRFWNGRITTFTTRDGLRSNSIGSLLVDDDGVLWAGSNTGLSRFENGRFRTLSSADGLDDDGVRQVLDDGLGNLWLGCSSGIYRLQKKELEGWRTGKIRRVHPLAFGKREGLLTPECISGTQPSCLRGPDGKLYFITLRSIAVIDPKQVVSNPVPPPVTIQDVVIDGKAITSIANRKSQIANVVIPPRALHVEFHFAGLSFTVPERVTYKYKMEGFDDDWVDGGRQRFASYTRMPPGAYRFQVLAANRDGVWNETGAVLGVTVQPAWYQTTVARALVGMVGISLLAAAYLARVTRLKRGHAAQQEFTRKLIASQEDERKRIAGELHDSLGQNLLILKNRLYLAEKEGSISGQLPELKKTVSQAISEVRAISLNLRPYHLEQLGLTKVIQSTVRQLAEASRMSITAEVDSVDGLFAPADEMNFYRIVQEGLNNVVKHADASAATLSVQRQDGVVRVRLEDDGRGFDYAALMNDPKRPRGLGLSGLAERARILGGRFDCDSAPGQGTRITIEIPVRDKQNASST